MYGGTKTEMERLLADAEKLTGQEYDINNLADVYSAIHAIQEELGVTGTTAKEAESTLSGSFMAMQSSLQNLLGDISLGRNVEPAMKALAESTGTFLFNNLIPALGNVFKSIPVVLGSFIYDGMPQLLQTLQNMLSGVAGGLANSGNIFKSAIDGVFDLAHLLLGNIGSIVDVGIEIATSLADGIVAGTPKLMDDLPILFNNIMGVLYENIPKILIAGAQIAKTLAIGVIQNIPALLSAIPPMFNSLLTAVGGITWNTLAQPIINGIKSGLAGLGSSLASSMANTKNQLVAPFQGAANTIKGIIGKIKSLVPIKIGKLFKGLKVPKFSLSYGSKDFGKLGTIKYPKGISVKWNAQGGILDTASLIGFGAGEDGREAILPLDKNTGWMDKLAGKVAELSGGSGGVVNIVMTLDGQVIGQSAVNYINGQTLQFNASPILL